MPIFWECDRCTACCRWPGDVRLDPHEPARIAAHLGLETHDFIQRFTRLNRTRSGLSLTEKTDGSCLFLDGRDCRIQPVKPRQCRGFPNLWNFPGFEKTCQAKPHHLPADAWRQRIQLACGEDPGEPGTRAPEDRADEESKGRVFPPRT